MLADPARARAGATMRRAMADGFAHPLRLQRFPDARRGRLPIAAPVLLGYCAFLLGAGGAALLGLWNAALLRRPGLFAGTLVLGALGWIAFGLCGALLLGAGVKTIQLVLLAGRLAGIAFGVLLAVFQARHVRGHVFLDGALIPLLPAVFGAFALQYVLPPKVLVVIQGFWLLLLPR